ncbi:hypothetical protein [Tamlana crocina]|uniref:Uncharacterized protein n=1 Tax=Tamlana crocina TaxID=393006 RepID=A0ABX1DBR2_9FLAO|nr:hypothetical protein [Tamlana crocina]NJX14707.1 hypothetical protein [Tamlana crocina]
MELLYQNEYGASYALENSFDSEIKFQIVIGSVGMFLTQKDIDELQDLVQDCKTESLRNKKNYDTIWKHTCFADVRIKLNQPLLHLLEDLVNGTHFVINMNATLRKNKIN